MNIETFYLLYFGGNMLIGKRGLAYQFGSFSLEPTVSLDAVYSEYYIEIAL